MNRSDRVLLTVVCLVCVGVALSGVVDFGSAATTPAPGSGTAVVSVDSAPADDIRFVEGRFDSGTYHLDAPPATVTADSVQGNPLVKLTLDIPALGHTDTTLYELHGREGDALALSFTNAEFSPRRVTESEYDATLGIWLHESGGAFTALYQERVTIEVHQ